MEGENNNNKIERKDSLADSIISLKNKLSINKKKLSDNKTFFIICFHDEIWKKISMNFQCNNSVSNKITKYILSSEISKNYLPRVYCIHFPENEERPTYIRLYTSFISFLNCELNELNIRQSKTRFLFCDTKYNESVTPIFINLAYNKFNCNLITYENYYLPLTFEQKLDIYYNYLENNKFDNLEKLIEYKENLVNDFIYIFRKSNLEKVNFSSMVKLLNLSYENNMILDFLLFTNKVIYIKGNFKDNFIIQLINTYIKNNNEVFRPLLKFTNKKNFNRPKYERLLNDFIITYLILYDKEKIMNNKDLILKCQEPLRRIYTEKDNNIETLKLLIEFFEILYQIYSFNEKKYIIEKIIIKNNKKQIIDYNSFNTFKKYYLKLADLQNKVQKNIIDLSDIIDKYINLYKNQLYMLQIIYDTFKIELKNDEKLRHKLNLCINNNGNDLFKQGLLKNKQILDFIKLNEIYKSYRNDKHRFILDNFISKNNTKYNKLKNVYILNGIEITSKLDPILKDIENYEIYNYFLDMTDEYLKIFTKKISNIKNLKAFYILLPIKYYDYKTTLILKDWIYNNINTFSDENTDFNEEMNIFFNLLISNLNEYTNAFIDFLIEYLEDNCLKLFLYILNNNNYLNNNLKKQFIMYFVNPSKYSEEYNLTNIEKLLYFILYYKKEDYQTIKIFLDEISIFIINEQLDFFSIIKTNRYKIFDLLINNKDKYITNKGGQYIDNMKDICKNILNNLKNANYFSYKIEFFFRNIKKEEFIRRIKSVLIFLNETKCIQSDIEKESIEIYDNLYKKVQTLLTNLNNLSVLINYIEIFFSKDKNKNKEKDNIKKLIEDLLNKKLNNIIASEEITNQIKYYEKLTKNAKENLERKKNSLLFNEIYKENEKRYNDNQMDILDETNKFFKQAINLISKNPDEIQKNFYIKYYYEIGYKNESDLDKEVDWLIKNNNIKINEDKKNKFLQSLKLLIKKQNIISIIRGILLLNNIYEDNIEPTNEDKYFLNELESYKNELTQTIPSHKIQLIINELRKLFIKITFDSNDKNYAYTILGFFNELINNRDVFYYLKKIKINKIQNIKEFFLYSDENDLTLRDIDDFLKVVSFLNEDINNIKSSFTLIETFINGILDNEKFGCYLNVTRNYNKIKDLIDKCIKNEKGVLTTINDIMKDSIFMIKLNEERNIYEIFGNYNKIYINQNEKKEKNLDINSEELDNLYQSVFILVHLANKQKSIKKFIYFYKEIKKINELINKLIIVYAYPKQIHINFQISQSNLKCSYDSKEYEINELYAFFKNIIKECDSIFSLYLSKYDAIRLFYGRQLYFINKCLEKKDYDSIKNLVSCATNGLINNYSYYYRYNIQENNIYKKMLENIINYIQFQLSYNEKIIVNIYESNSILDVDNNKKENEIKINRNIFEINYFKGFYFFASSQEEYDILTLFKNMTGNWPNNSNILICNNDTSFEEINTFIIRAIYCKMNSLFMIVISNYLNINEKTLLFNYLKEKSKKEAQMMTSCLIILFSIKDSDFHQSISKLNIEFMNINNSFINKQNNNKEDSQIKVQIIHSYMCGLGKSSFIQNKKQKNDEIIYLPIGGELTKDDLVKRIKKAFPIKLIDSTNYILHIDLTQSSNDENYIIILRDFFFKLLILHKLELYENVIYLKQNVQIYIELANDFCSYANVYKILFFFPEKKIVPINKINLTRESRIVSRILKNYENNEILNHNINLKNDFNISENEHEQIILKYLGIENPNYYQINTFIKVLSCQFEKFNSCYGFDPGILTENATFMKMTKEKALGLRKLIISSLIKITKYFTIGPYENLIKTQNNAKLVVNKLYNDNSIINNYLSIKIDSITYDIINPSLVVFNNDGSSVTILTTCNENEEEFKSLENLYNSQNPEYLLLIRNFGINGEKNVNNIPKLKSLKNLDYKNVLDILLNFLNVNGLSNEQIKNLVGTYVFTADNFIKIVLILLRIRAQIPVIMMGETGCGKTTLIEMAFKLINKGNNEIKKLNIHAGTNDQDIIDFIEKITKEAEDEDTKLLIEKDIIFNQYSDEQKSQYIKSISKEEIIKEYIYEIKTRQIWVFFDEINTCNSMGLLTEILCKHTCRGNPIDKRFVFIGACNPYRLLIKERKIDSILFHKNAQKKKLVYSVNPLPHSMLNFVFNFGNLKINDEKKYIESMTKENIISLFPNYVNNINDKKVCNELIDIIIDTVSLAQKFMKDNNDVSIVSLREVNRFLLFFQFFIKFILKRNQKDEIFNGDNYKLIEDDIVKFYKNQTDIFYYKCSVNLSLFICYYLRLPDKETRQNFEELINSKKYFEKDFLFAPSLEMNYVVDNLNIPIGIAKNKALKENLFSALYCIVNKIPLIICGKPGHSKTLSIRILQNSLKGKGAKTYLCKSFNELIIHKIQGSLNTRTSDVIDCFKKARELQKEAKDKISLVLMDEMGLAELSSNNPLKVTHYELENEKEKISFIGITNWGLDASKMNRVIYIVVQEPDEEDLILTSKEIVKSYNNGNEYYYNKYSNVFNCLSKAYYEYIEDKKKINDENKFFHGLRDFYNLIKTITIDIKDNKELLAENINNIEQDELYNIAMINIERNFGGLKNSVNEFKYYFNKLFNIDKKYESNNRYELLKCLKNSIYDPDSRYLLMISDSFLSKDILYFMLEEINNQINEEKDKNMNIDKEENIKKSRKKIIKTFLGSKFISDEKNIYYSDDILFKIKHQMETENILILKDLEIVYPALYELFNRSFIDLQGIKFVYLGKSRSLSLVNDNFKVIILLDQKNIPLEDPPFLNRFEKHIISFSNILDNELISMADDIYSNLKKMLSFDLYFDNKNNFLLNRNIKFISNEEVRGLVYMAKKNKYTEKNDIIKYILNKIVPTFTEDLMIIIHKFDSKAKPDFYNEVLDIYKNNYSYNLNNFISKTKDKVSIVYTFSFFNDNLFEDKDEIENKYFNKIITKKSVKEIKINDINSINNLNKSIIDFLTEDEKNLCIIRFAEKDLIKLNDVHNAINEYISKDFDFYFDDAKTKNKLFIILIHLSRYAFLPFDKKINNDNDNDYFISFLSSTNQYFIDNLNNKYKNFVDILHYSNEELIMNTLEIKDKKLLSQINNSLRNFKYTIFNLKKKSNKEKYINIIENNVIHDNNKNIKDDNNSKKYKEELIFTISKNIKIKAIIKKGIVSLLKNGEDILKQIFNNNIIKYEDSDFLETLYIYISEKIESSLTKLIYLFEQNQIFVSLLSNENLFKYDLIIEKINNYIEGICNINTDKLNLNGININNKIETKILYGIKTPFLQKIINDSFNFIKTNIAEKYIQKEAIITFKKIQDENIEIEKNRYKEEIQQINNILKNEIFNYPFLISILKSKNIELIKNLFNDCFLVFLMRSNIFHNDYFLLINLLDIIIQLRLKTRLNNNLSVECFSEGKKINLEESFLDLYIKDNKNNNIIENLQENENIINENDGYQNNKDNTEDSFIDIFVRVLNFIESYSKEIYYILEVYYFIYINIKPIDRIQNFENMIIENKVNLEKSERNPIYTHINKISFFYVIENLLKQIMFIFNNKNFLNMYNYYVDIKCYLTNLFKLEKRFLLFSKELFNLKIIIKIFEYYEKNTKEKVNINEYEKVIRKIITQTKLLEPEKYNNIYNDFQDINNSLKNIYGEYSDSYSELMNSIILNRYKLINNQEIRKNLIKIIVPDDKKLSNIKLIEKSYSLISRIIGRVEPEYNEEEDITKLKKNLKFLQFIKNPKDYEYKKILNQDYPGLNEVVLYYFENSCKSYFDKIELKEKSNIKLSQKLCGGLSKLYLEEAINFLKKGNKNVNSLNILGKLFCIAYIKRYLNIYVNLLFENINHYQYLVERNDINKLLFNEKYDIIKEIKYYTLKLCLVKKNNNYEELINYFETNDGFDFKIYFQDINLKKSDSFFYSLIPNFINENDFNIYKNYIHEKINENNLDDNNFENKFKREFNNKNFDKNDIIYTFLYYLFYESYLTKSKNKQCINKLISLNLIKDTKQIFNILLKENDNNNINDETLINKEILFYAMRYVFNILLEKNNKNFYYKILTQEAINTINNNMVPGKLYNNNNMINSFKMIKENFYQNPDYGGYLCSCGYHYSIDSCSFPTIEFSCPVCGKTIGGKNHILHRREGHKRIFFNIQYKIYYTNLNYADKDIPYVLLSDLEEEINKQKNLLFKGLKKESKEYFLQRRTKIRDINYITFRILNFILHGFIYYGNLIRNIDNDYLNNNLIENMSCFEIMKKDWEIIDQELKIKQISNVQIFMNIIFNKVLLEMKKQKLFNTDVNLNNFELAIDRIVIEEMNNKKAVDEYRVRNNLITKTEKMSDKSIILELDINNFNLEKDYPDMKYFSKTKLPELNDFQKEFISLEENKDKYPIINYILDKNSKYKYLKYLPIINKLCNNIINYCSYRMSREEAKEKLIKNEIKNNDEFIDNFIDIYNKLRPYIKRYECHEFKDRDGKLYFNDLSNDLKLSNFCVDIGEFNYGMVLAATYKEMINWQNQFINVVLNSKNEYHKNYSDLFKQEIMIQDCNENDIINFPSNEEFMNDIIIHNSYQKNFGIIQYNFGLIEEELASIILPQIKKFNSNDDNCLRYVIYQYEGFRGNKSNIITMYIQKYKTRELTDEELRIILNYKKHHENVEDKKIINILFSLQILIDIILENNYSKNELLSDIIEKNITDRSLDILISLFNNRNHLFTVDCLMSVFNIFEIICWDKIKDNLDKNNYLMEINDQIKQKFEKFPKIEIITKKNLSTAIRRFVSRYLSGKRGDNEINQNNNLLYYLSKQELWDDPGIIDNEKFVEELNILFDGDEGSAKICVGQAANLYEYLGGDKSLINELYNRIGENEVEQNKINLYSSNYIHEDDNDGNSLEEDDNDNDDNNKIKDDNDTFEY